MDKRVTVLLPNARRINVNVSANTTLLEILETACKKHGYNSDEYCLKFHNKEISLSQMFRFSGLPNNCVLEMEPTERKRAVSNVIVCVQLSDGSREQAEFSPSSSIWEVLEVLHANEIKRYESPVVIYMRSEVVGKERLQQTTLKSLGILEGRVMLRLLDKKPEELKTQANVYKPPAVQDKTNIKEDEKPQTSRSAMTASQKSSGNESAPKGGGFAITSKAIKNLKRSSVDKKDAKEKNSDQDDTTKTPKSEETEKPKYDWGTGSGYSMHKPQITSQQNDDAEMDESELYVPKVNIIGPRHALIFSLDESKRNADDLPDSFFDLTVNDLKMVLRDLQRTSSGNDDAPLLTEKLRELERQKLMLNKLNQYKDCVLRIQFPDRYVLQGIFKPHENLSHVEDFVREFLENKEIKFHLFTIPPKNILPSDKSLLELDFVPNAIVHFAYEHDAMNNNKYLQQKFIDQISTEEAAHYAVQKYRLTRVES